MTGGPGGAASERNAARARSPACGTGPSGETRGAGARSERRWRVGLGAGEKDAGRATRAVCWARAQRWRGERWAARLTGQGTERLRKREGRGVRAAAGLERGVGLGHGDWTGVLGCEHGVGWRKEVRVGPGKPGLWAERGGKLGQD
jgi:hypothetical protein